MLFSFKMSVERQQMNEKREKSHFFLNIYIVLQNYDFFSFLLKCISAHIEIFADPLWICLYVFHEHSQTEKKNTIILDG